MNCVIVNVDKLSYKDLTELHKFVKENIKDVDSKLAELGKTKKPAEYNQQDITLLQKHINLNQLRLRIAEKIMAFAETVQIPEGSI
jgi:uncharacterized membrane protein YgaE (UPF0421/DUF939 family)